MRLHRRCVTTLQTRDCTSRLMAAGPSLAAIGRRCGIPSPFDSVAVSINCAGDVAAPPRPIRFMRPPRPAQSITNGDGPPPSLLNAASPAPPAHHQSPAPHLHFDCCRSQVRYTTPCTACRPGIPPYTALG